MKLHEVLDHHEFTNSPIDFNNKDQLIMLLRKKMYATSHIYDIKYQRLLRAKERNNKEQLFRLHSEIQDIEQKMTLYSIELQHVESGRINKLEIEKLLKEASETIHKHKLWVDDLRNPPDESFDVARTYDEAVSMLSKYQYTDLFLDHDLGDFSGPDGRERSGYDVLMFLVHRKHDGDYVPMNFHILTANPVGRSKFEGVINRYLRK